MRHAASVALWSVLLLAAAAPACGPASAPSCAPGRAQPCACTDGRSGVQACSDDGTRFGACVCEAALDAAADADAALGDDGALGDDVADVRSRVDGVVASAQCLPGLVHCGRCVDTQWDPANCGGCGRQCGAGQWCNAGTCEGACPGARVLCSDRCIDTTTDRMNCGACGHACAAGQACSGAVCRRACSLDQSPCATGCFSLVSDPQNCGACGQACGAQEYCDIGRCVASNLPLALQVEYPLALRAGTAARPFPLYLSHLIGSDAVMHPLEMQIACVRLSSRDGLPHSARITVDIPGFATAPASADVAVAARGSVRTCLHPTFTAAQVNALTESTRTQLTYSVEMLGTTFTARDYISVDLLPVRYILWRPPYGGVSQDDMDQLSAVFVQPEHPTLLALRDAVQARSAWPGGIAGYARPVRARVNAIAAGSYAYEVVYLEHGEALTLDVRGVEGAPGIDVSLFRPGAYAAWARDRSGMAAQAWPASAAGASQTFTSAAGGWYVLVLSPPGPDSVRVAWSRSNTAEDVAEDALRAVYTELRARGIGYTDISASFYRDTQFLRTPAEVLTTGTGNCVEGALLFASLLEAFGMEPVLVFTELHAYVAVRSRASASGTAGVLWPVETTLMERADFDVAFDVARAEIARHAITADHFGTVDVRAARAAGIVPEL